MGVKGRRIRVPGSIWCAIDDCQHAADINDWCQPFKVHALEVLRGRAILVDPPVDPLAYPVVGPCWVGVGNPNEDGYMHISIGSRVRRIHRVTLAATRDLGSLSCDHLCRNPPCFNPDHLEAVTQKVNTLRGASPAAVNARRRYCIRGHEFTPENTQLTRGGRRQCRICMRMLQRRYYYADMPPALPQAPASNPLTSERKAQIKAWRHANPEKVAEYNRRQRERRRAALVVLQAHKETTQ